MKVQLISTTNTKFEYVVGEEGNLDLSEGYSAIFFKDNGWSLMTSKVMSFSIPESIITVNTYNSVYVFEIVE